MKKTALLILAFFLSLPLFCHEGSMAGAGKLRVSQTKYFDIIYSEKNLESARILYEKADAVFEELAASYGITPYFRLPVVITSTVEQFNAYYSDSPYNRIVLYDTAQIADLAVFSETLLSTFTHELTHALTYNLKSKAFIILGKLFGDAFSGHYITVTSGMAEGATVSYESSKGEGRLNDSYSLQLLRQSKIEGKFPSYSDVKGASDAYPRNAFYFFNGAFAEYLQKNYGMEKYAEFWYYCVNAKRLTAAGAFRKVYGIKLNMAWKQFKESVYVPEVAAPEPVKAGLSDDFFKPGRGKLSIKNKSGSLYTNLCSSENGMAFVDSSCDTVYFYSDGKIKKLFDYENLDSIKLSKDGRFLTVSYYSIASHTIKHKAAIYDIQQSKWIWGPGTNYVEPAVVGEGKNYYLVSQKYEQQKYSICVNKILFDGKKEKVSDEIFAQYFFEAEQVPAYFADLGNGNFAFVLKSGMEYSVCTTDIALSNITEYELPLEGMKVRDLSAADRLVFSWATKETLPRLGYLDLTDGTFTLANENISGGIYTPVEYEGRVYYTGSFYKESRLLELKARDEGRFQTYKKQLEEPEAAQEDLALEEALALEELGAVEGLPDPFPYKPFSPWRYTFEGFIVPVGGLNSTVPTLGFTYFTSLPWYASIAMLSGGYDIQSKSGLFDLSYQSGTDTQLLQYVIGSSLVVNKDGFKKLRGEVSLTSSFDFGRRSAISFVLQADAKYEKSLADFFTSTQLFSAGYSNTVRTGPGTYEKGGITFVAGVVHSYETIVKPIVHKYSDLYDLEFDFGVYIPKLLPVVCADDFTYNFPLTIKTFLFSLSSQTMRLARVNAETVLFAYDIQKAVPGLTAIFANEAALSLGYTGGFDYLYELNYQDNWHFLKTAEYIDLIKNREIEYVDYFTLKLSLGLTPNFGAFANPQLKSQLYFRLHLGKAQNLPDKIFDFGFEANYF